MPHFMHEVDFLCDRALNDRSGLPGSKVRRSISCVIRVKTEAPDNMR